MTQWDFNERGKDSEHFHIADHMCTLWIRKLLKDNWGEKMQQNTICPQFSVNSCSRW